MSKTNYMVFSNMNYNIDDIRIHMDKSQLLHTNHTKFLGVHIDESMSWKYHLGDVCSKISSSCWYPISPAQFITRKKFFLLFTIPFSYPTYHTVI